MALRGVAARREEGRTLPPLRQRRGLPARRWCPAVPRLQVDRHSDIRLEIPPKLVTDPTFEDARGAVGRAALALTNPGRHYGSPQSRVYPHRRQMTLHRRSTVGPSQT